MKRLLDFLTPWFWRAAFFYTVYAVLHTFAPFMLPL